MTKQYSKRERQMFVRQLKKARPLIENGKEYFVCYALSSSLSSSRTRKVRDMIRYRIYPNSTVTGWLGSKDTDTHEYLLDNNKYREYRLAWIDNMIEEFSQ
jgi:hypothetical protein